MSHETTATHRPHFIDHSASAPPVAIPPGHVGEFVIPGTGRTVWWTGRVAIGLLHKPERYFEAMSESSLWLQSLMLGGSAGRASAKV
ncbi:MAG: hypothetical protein ABL916_01105 [Burkholderiaceae bacterium]